MPLQSSHGVLQPIITIEKKDAVVQGSCYIERKVGAVILDKMCAFVMNVTPFLYGKKQLQGLYHAITLVLYYNLTTMINTKESVGNTDQIIVAQF